ncbi:MAG: dTDP-4-dehydrorhamnose 3,5-epimerase family protein [Acidimicrobiales bacterium]
MKLAELPIPGAFLLESPVWEDDRGYFREWFKWGDLEAAGVAFPIQQANLSMSKRNVVRGLHYSLAPEGQAKIVTCACGELDDVLVDVRVGSPTYGLVEVVHLAASEERSVLIPAGIAHGFCMTSDIGVLTYLLSSPFNAEMELEINPFDEVLNVPWPLSGGAIVSPKDADAPTLGERLSKDELPRFMATTG